MRYRLAIFDFDGTLADTFPWFRGVLNQVADRYGFRRVEEHEVDELRGLNAREIIRRLEVPLWKVPFIARHMRALVARDIDRIRLFDGVPEMLRRLADGGVTLAIVTSNSEPNVRRVLGPELSSLIRHFGCGASMFGKRSKLRRALDDLRVREDAAIAIGDELRDHEAARAAGIASAMVTWGYTLADALRAAAPDALFETPDEIARALAPASRPALC
jgi:phosphoglycolate phosphatase